MPSFIPRSIRRWRLCSLVAVIQLLNSIAYAVRSVHKMTPIIGKNFYSEKFDYFIPDATWTDATKLTVVKFCTQNFYNVALGTFIELTWSSGVKFSRETINYNTTPLTCVTRNVVGEIGKVKVMLAASDQIQGLILVETAADYSTQEWTLGSISQNNPKTIHLDGPIIGVYGSYLLEFDALQFYVDKTYCYRSQINAFSLPNQTTILGKPITFSLIPTSGAYHALGGGIYRVDPCTVKYVESSIITNGLFTISGTSGNVGAKWADTTKILPAEVGLYQQSWTVTASYSAYQDIVVYQVAQKFDILITPACNYSKIIFESNTAVITDMTTPYMAYVTQTLPVYTHEYANKWYTNPCLISTKIESGGSRLRKVATDLNSIEAYSQNIADENTSITSTIKAYYSTYPDASVPTQFKINPIKVTIEPRCNIKNFKGKSVSPAVARYVIGASATKVYFSFSFAEKCTLIQTYSAKVFQNGVQVVPTPPFISFDHPNDQLSIYSTNVADASSNNGFYDVQITSTFNLRDPNAIQVSQDTVNFQIIIATSPCLQTQIKPVTLTDMTYFIDSQGGTALDQLFIDFKDTITLANTANCGAKVYKMTLSDPAGTPAITLGDSSVPATPWKITINTLEMSTVGDYEATIFVTLASFPQYDSIIGVSVKLDIFIENGCLKTIFKLASPLPQMIQFIGSSTKDPVQKPLQPVPDSKSLLMSDGFSYCGNRLYTLVLKEIGSFVSQNSTHDVASKQFTGNGPLWLDTQTMTLVLEGKDKSQIGRYTYELHVDLAKYQGPKFMDQIGVFPFKVYIIDDCADSHFTGLFQIDSQSVKVGQKSVIVQLPQNAQTISKDSYGNMVIKKAEIQVQVSTLYQALTGIPDKCGKIDVNAGLMYNQPLPDFMIFDDFQNTIEIAPTRNDQVGQYEVALSYVLADYSAYKRVQLETFKVQVVLNTINHMPYLQKVIGFHTKVSLSIDEVFEFPLDIVDPDAFSWETMRTTFTCNPQIDSFTFWNSTAESAKFTFKAQATDAGHAYRVDVQVLDLGLIANYTWIIYVKMPTPEQVQVLIDAVVKKSEKEISIIVRTKNEVEGSFITENTLPVVRPHDIEILRGLKQYPLPYVESIDRSGKIVVRFSRAIANCTTEAEIAKNTLAIDQGLSFELVSGDTGEVIALSGHNQNKSLNTVTNQQSRRQLQSETIDADLLSWKITELNSEGFVLNFSLKEQVDSLISAQNNVLKLIFNDGDKYLVDDQTGIKISENRFYIARIVVPKQLPEEEVSKNIAPVIGFLSQFMQGAVIGVFALGFLFDFPFEDFWIFLSCLVLLSHVALNRALQHVYTELIYEMIMTVTRCDFFNIKFYIDKWLFDNWEFTSTGAYSTFFYTMQYESRNVVSNIGPINVIFLLVSITIVLQVIFLPKVCLFFKCSRGLTLRVKKWKPQTFLIRFFLLFFLVLGISALIPLSSYSDGQEGFVFMETKQQGGSNVDQALELYTYFVIVILGVFLLVTVVFSCSQARKLYIRSLLSQTSRRAALVLEIFTGQRPKDTGIELKRVQAGYYDQRDDYFGEQKLGKVKRRDLISEQPDELVVIKLDDFWSSPFAENRSVPLDLENSGSITEITSGEKIRTNSPKTAMNGNTNSLFADPDPTSFAHNNLPENQLNSNPEIVKPRDRIVQLYRNNLSRTDNAILMKHLGKFIDAAAKAQDPESYIEQNRKLRTTSLEQAKKSPLLWTDIEQYQFFIEFMKGIRQDSSGIKLYYTLYLIRRSLLMVALVFLHEYKALTILVFVNLTFLTMLGHVVMRKPFLSERANWLDRVCEIVIYLACMIQVIQISYFEVADDRADIQASKALLFFGWANLALVGIFCPLVTLLISGHTLFKVLRIIQNAIKAFINWRRKKRAEAQRLEELKEEAINNVAEKLAEEKEAADLQNAQKVEQTSLSDHKNDTIINTNTGMLDESIKPGANKKSQLTLISPRDDDSDDEGTSKSVSSSEDDVTASNNDQTAPDKEIPDDDALSVTNRTKLNQIAPDTEESVDKSQLSAKSGSSDKVDVNRKSKIYKKKRDKMSQALKTLKQQAREKKTSLENEDALYASEGEERGPGPAIQTATREYYNTTFGAPAISRRRPERHITFSIEEEDEEDSNSLGDTPKRMNDKKNLERLREENKQKQTQTQPVDFMKMNDLERMTDPFRRPSINKNDIILPLPTRKKHRRIKKRDEMINSIESLIEELDFTEGKDNSGPIKRENSRQVNVIDQLEEAMIEITSKKPYM